MEVEFLKNKKNSKIVIPIIGTKTMIKENSAASFFDVLRNRAVEIVKPDLEIPGTTAIACAIPMINALNRLIEFLPDLEASLPKETSIFSELDNDFTVELIAVLKSSSFSFLFSTLYSDVNRRLWQIFTKTSLVIF